MSRQQQRGDRIRLGQARQEDGDGDAFILYVTCFIFRGTEAQKRVVGGWINGYDGVGGGNPHGRRLDTRFRP